MFQTDFNPLSRMLGILTPFPLFSAIILQQVLYFGAIITNELAILNVSNSNNNTSRLFWLHIDDGDLFK